MSHKAYTDRNMTVKLEKKKTQEKVNAKIIEINQFE